MQFLVNIDVDDLDRAIGFYTSAFGLRCERRLFNGTVAEMAGGTAKLYLLLKSAGSAASTMTKDVRRYSRHWTPVHLDFEVSDISAAVSSAVAAGATLERGVQCFVWGQHAELSDPFGNGFCLLKFNSKGYTAVE